MVCNKQLSTGEELYIIDENKFVCKEDYVSSSSLKESSLNSGKAACLHLTYTYSWSIDPCYDVGMTSLYFPYIV